MELGGVDTPVPGQTPRGIELFGAMKIRPVRPDALRAGFTLIEIMIVVLIIGLLVAGLLALDSQENPMPRE